MRKNDAKFETVTVTVKGQIVIPSRWRRKHGIKKGTSVCLIDKGDAILLKPITDEFLKKSSGILGTSGKLLKALAEEGRNSDS